MRVMAYKVIKLFKDSRLGWSLAKELIWRFQERVIYYEPIVKVAEDLYHTCIVRRLLWAYPHIYFKWLTLCFSDQKLEIKENWLISSWFSSLDHQVNPLFFF